MLGGGRGVREENWGIKRIERLGMAWVNGVAVVIGKRCWLLLGPGCGRRDDGG